jgi:vacuolar-type H+-ATPase subunit I/STV1
MHSFTTAPSRFSWAARPMPRSRRRALVLATYLGFAAFMAVMYGGYTAQPRWPALLAIIAAILFVATAGSFGRLVTAPGYAADSVDQRLDERQRLVRDRAYRMAYYAVALLFGVLSLGIMYAAGLDDTWSSVRVAALFLPWLTFLVGSLPTAVVAWTEPDLPEDN